MNKSASKMETAKIEVILRDLLITTLASAGVNGGEIRKIVGCDMNRVTRIVKHMRQEGK
jgi:hypothetical protein